AEVGQGDRDDGRLRRDVGPLVSGLPGRHLAAALAPRPVAPRDGGGGFHRLRGGVVALRLQGLDEVPDRQPDVRGADEAEVTRGTTVFVIEQTKPVKGIWWPCPGLLLLARGDGKLAFHDVATQKERLTFGPELSYGVPMLTVSDDGRW